MEIWWGVMAIVVLYAAFNAACYLRRPVTRIAMSSPEVNLTLDSWTRSGGKGFSVFLFHARSRIMVKVDKVMPANRRNAKVSLYVSKWRLGEKAPDVKSYRYDQVRGYECATVWCWNLPRLRNAQRLEKVRCLGSLKRVSCAVSRMMSEEPAVKEGDRVLIWRAAGKSWFAGSQFGLFDD